MLKKIALILVVLIAGVLLYAATRPDSMHVERTATINAPPDRIFPHINDFKQWTAWSPYEKLDPGMKKTYSGAERGRGAVYEWAGNSQAGQGRMEITDSAEPSRVTIKLDFIAPFGGGQRCRVPARAPGQHHGGHVDDGRPDAVHGEADGRLREHGHYARIGFRVGSREPQDDRREVTAGDAPV
jgi:hypothetical protein